MLYLFLTILIGSLAITVWAHYFIFHALTGFLNITGRLYLNLLRAAFIILPVSFILASILISRFNNALVRFYYAIASVWLGAVLYLFLACLAAYSLLFLGKALGWNLNQKTLTLSLLALAAAVIVYGLFEARNLTVKNLTVSLPNLPVEWRGKTAIWVSDIHLGPINGEGFAASLAEKISALKPDLLLIGGDFYDGQKNLDLKKMAGAFSAIPAPLGKFFITGNHEEFDGAEAFVDALGGAGVTYLNNQMLNINGLQLIGLDYRAAYDRKNFADILKNLKIDPAKPSLLMRHVPDKLDVAIAAGVSLVLCGHTHRGQLFPVELVTFMLYDGFAYGLKTAGHTQVYTSSGAGTWGPPLRVLARPEIVRITFNSLRQ